MLAGVNGLVRLSHLSQHRSDCRVTGGKTRRTHLISLQAVGSCFTEGVMILWVRPGGEGTAASVRQAIAAESVGPICE